MCRGCGHTFFNWTWSTSRILHRFGVSISGNKIETCHWLGKNSDRTIVIFSTREDCEHTMRVKKKIERSWCSWPRPSSRKLYINDSLCPYYIGLWNVAKKLWNKKKIFFYLIFSGTVRIRLQQKGPYSIITHINDLKELFSDENFSMFWLDCIVSCLCKL